MSTLAAVAPFASKRLNLSEASHKDLTTNGCHMKRLAFLMGCHMKRLSQMASPDWFEVCRELAPDIYNVEQQYKDCVNFVILNVDNTKWEQELDEFRVEGILHFAFLDKEGNEEGNVVGRLPNSIFFKMWLHFFLVIPTYLMHEWSVSSRVLNLGKFIKFLIPEAMGSSSFLWAALTLVIMRRPFDKEHAKPIRESLTYYLCTHQDNQILLPAIRDIVQQHGINLSDM